MIAQPRADPGEEERRREQDDGEGVVVGALDEPLHVLGRGRGPRLEAIRVSGGGKPVLGQRERRERCGLVLQRLGRDPRREGRLELVAKALAVKSREPHLPLCVRVDPLDEDLDVDLGVPIGEARGPGGFDPRGDRGALRLSLLAVPSCRLVARPGGRHRRGGEQHGRRKLDPVMVGARRSRLGRRRHLSTSAPDASQGRAVWSPRTSRSSSRMRSVRSIAAGLRLPTPGR